METIGRFFRKILILIRRERFDADLGEEMRFHRDQQARDCSLLSPM
jgi:hypothetical protein